MDHDKARELRRIVREVHSDTIVLLSKLNEVSKQLEEVENGEGQ